MINTALGTALTFIPLHTAAVVSATAAGATKVDLSGYEAGGMAVLSAGAGGSGVTVNAKIRHCDTVDGTYEDAPDGAFPAGAANAAQDSFLAFRPGYFKRFIEVHFTVAGGTGTGAASVGLILAKKYNH